MLFRSEIRALDFNYEAALVMQVSTEDQIIIKEVDAWATEDLPYFSIVLLRSCEPLRSES